MIIETDQWSTVNWLRIDEYLIFIWLSNAKIIGVKIFNFISTKMIDKHDQVQLIKGVQLSLDRFGHRTKTLLGDESNLGQTTPLVTHDRS